MKITIDLTEDEIELFIEMLNNTDMIYEGSDIESECEDIVNKVLRELEK